MEEEPEPTVRDWPPRTAGLLLGTLVIATAFIAAYVGAPHEPAPRDLPVGVTAADDRARAVLAAVRDRTDTIKARVYDDQAAAEDGLLSREVYGVLAADPAGGLRLVAAGASAPAATEVITRTLTEAARQAQLPLRVTDEVPVEAADPRGVVPFYLAVGFVLGGYLTATALGLRTGTAPGTLRWAGLRIGALATYSIALGVTGAVVVGPVLGVWDHDLPAVTAAGALTVLAAATVAAAIQAWWGPIGTDIVILLLVVIGNPGSGGIYAPEFLPEWLRGMHRWNASGLSTNLIKSVVYFDRRAAVWPAAVLTVWTLLGVLGVLSATIYHARRRASRAARRSATPPTSAHASPAG